MSGKPNPGKEKQQLLQQQRREQKERERLSNLNIPVTGENDSSKSQGEFKRASNQQLSNAGNSIQQQQQKSQQSKTVSNTSTTSIASTTVNPSIKISSRLALFDHLPRKISILNQDSIEGDKLLHPSTIKIGIMFRQGLIREDDDRVAALLATFCNIIDDYKTPPNTSLSRDLDKHIRNQVIN